MGSLELHPKLPQELRDKILAYIVQDEIIGLEVNNTYIVITNIKYKYSRNLRRLMDDEDVRDQLQHLIYEHAILDLTSDAGSIVMSDRGMSQNYLKTELRPLPSY